MAGGQIIKLPVHGGFDFYFRQIDFGRTVSDPALPERLGDGTHFPERKLIHPLISIRIATRRILCRACGASTQEAISFCSDAYVRYTLWAARFALVLRADMSIKAVAERTGMHWETVKNIEKEWLEKKYRRVPLGNVEHLGTDEM